MSRIELHQRTKDYSIFRVVDAKMFSTVVILVVIVLSLKNPQLILDNDILYVFIPCGAVALFWILRYWKHWPDIFEKDLVPLEDEVFSEGVVPGPNAESP